MMEHLHREIIQLIIRRRSALSQGQIEKSLTGYKSHLVEGALNLMIVDQHLQYHFEGNKVFYQITLAGYQAAES